MSTHFKLMRKKVRPRTRQIIKERLAIGASHREAIQGTGVVSKATAGSIAKQDKIEIALMRKAYLEMIEKNGATDENRAKQWANMTTAKKTTKDGGKEADWQSREKALKYIDKMKSLNPEDGSGRGGGKTQVNVFSGVKKNDENFVD